MVVITIVLFGWKDPPKSYPLIVAGGGGSGAGMQTSDGNTRCTLVWMV